MSRLLQLPTELRLQIYEHVFDLEFPSNPALEAFRRASSLDATLRQNGHIVIGGPPARPWQCRSDPFHPSLLQVSSTIRDEALPLLYQDRMVVLVLRYREGRAQVRRWIETLSRSSIMSKRVRCVSIQFFEEPHRATAVLVDLARLELVNKSWLLRNPQVQRYPVMMSKLEDVLLCARTKNDSAGSLDFAAILNKLTSIMTKAVSTSSLHHHSIANLRLHGYLTLANALRSCMSFTTASSECCC